jgi:hypothetical protein
MKTKDGIMTRKVVKQWYSNMYIPDMRWQFSYATMQVKINRRITRISPNSRDSKGVRNPFSTPHE